MSLCVCQIGEFYSKDSFGLELAVEFWCPSESLQHTSLTGSFLGVALQRPPHKQVCTCPLLHPFCAFALSNCTMIMKEVVLCLQKYVHQMCVVQVVLSKFVRQMGDLLPATLYIPYLRMLKGLSNGPQCSHYCFSLLKSNGPPHGKASLQFPIAFKVRAIAGT